MSFCKVKRFDRNTTGRDFVVGDIHGCFDAVRKALSESSFDESRDRLFSVGDLVDRGPDSEEAIDWIAKPWFHAVRGNHEQMAIGVAAGKHDTGNYLQNGGGWFLMLPEDRQKLIANVFATLPFAIEIDHAIGKVGIVHAEIVGDGWNEFCGALEADQSNNKFRNLTETVLWARTKITYKDPTPVTGAARVYVGHTPLKDYGILGNVYYVDTGAVFNNKLTLMEIA